MSTPTIYHNPRCTKSRQTLALIEEQGAEPNVVEYLKEPPDEKTLRSLIKKLGIKPIELVRTKEPEWKATGLGKDASDDDVISAMLETPKLIERPIVVVGNKARIGRPPENVLEIL